MRFTHKEVVGKMRPHTKWFWDERGQSLIEMAVIGSLLALILLAAVNYGRVMAVAIRASTAARAGADYAVFNPDATLQDVANVVLERLGDLGEDAVATVTFEKGTDTYGGYVRVTVTVGFSDTNLFPMPTLIRTVRLPLLSTG